MQVIQAAKALAAQLSALDLLACRGTQSLSVPCEVEDLVGWLNAQCVTPRLYWQPREASAAGYAVLGEARAFDSLVALQVDMQRQAQGQAQSQAQAQPSPPAARPTISAGWPSMPRRRVGPGLVTAASYCPVCCSSVSRGGARFP